MVSITWEEYVNILHSRDEASDKSESLNYKLCKMFGLPSPSEINAIVTGVIDN